MRTFPKNSGAHFRAARTAEMPQHGCKGPKSGRRERQANLADLRTRGLLSRANILRLGASTNFKTSPRKAASAAVAEYVYTGPRSDQ
jgi:hypothetical protein